MLFSKGKSILLRILGIAIFACSGNLAMGSGPSFLISVSNNAPRLSELLEVSTEPFATRVISTTNSGIVYTTDAPWSAMAFDPAGTLYGITLDSGLASIDPATAAYSVFANLHESAIPPGNGSLITGAGMAVSTNGSAYVSDGFNLYQVDLGSGLCTFINPFSQVGSDATTFAFALTESPSGTMFGLFLGLYTVNLTNAQVSQIGPAFPFGGGSFPNYALSAAFGSDGNLYMAGTDSNKKNHPKLYLVSTNDGTAIALGDLPFGAQSMVALPATNGSAPTIVIPPVSQTVRAGEAASFSVNARGTPEPSIQWYFGNTEEPGATNSTLTISNASPTNAGSYYVVLSNTNGQATSQQITLTVVPTILGSSGSAGEFTNSILGLTTNPPTELALLKTNLFFSCLSFDPQGVLYALGNAATPGNGFKSLYTINTQTWMTNLVGNFQTGNTGSVGMAFSPAGVLHLSFGGSLYTMDTSTLLTTKLGAFPSGVAIEGIAFAPDGTLYGGQTNLYIIQTTNAVVTNIGALNGVSAAILADMKYGADGFLYFFDGLPSGNFYRLNKTNAQVSVVATFASALSGLAFIPVPTTVTWEPTNQIVANGGTANFSVAATGTGPFAYQWYFNKTLVKGGTNLELTVADASTKNNGNYYIVISNALGAVTSSVVTLSTFLAPTITKAPKNQIISAGQTISLSAAATGSPLQYQWQLNGTNLPGRTAASLVIPHAQANEAGTYTINVSVPALATPAFASANVAVLPLKPVIAFPANHAVVGSTHLVVIGTEPFNGGAAAILYKLNGGETQEADLSTNGFTWSASLVLTSATNVLTVWATNSSGSSPTITVNYTFNTFLPVVGTYNGLFSSVTAPAFPNSGYLQLTVNSVRDFSGNLLIGAVKTSFTGQFDTNGMATVVAGKAPGNVYELALQVDLSGVNPLIGSVSNVAQEWTAPLAAVRASFGSKTPATNFQGTYLLAVNGATNPVFAPTGYSIASASISATGVVTLSGTMADGTSFTDMGTGISESGDWPLYSSLLSGKGSVQAWIKFPMHSSSNQLPTAQAEWFENAKANTHYYPNGFNLTSNQLSLMVDRYLPPTKGVAVLPDVNYTVQIFGGNLVADLNEKVTVTANNVVVPPTPNTNKLSIVINAAKGTFSGSFVSPATGKPTALKGVLLPGVNAGFGYFLGTNQTGGIFIHGPLM